MEVSKIITNLVLVLFILLNDLIAQPDDCPAPQILKPCRCYLGFMSCMNTTITPSNLANIFENLTKVLPKGRKHFKRFHMSEEQNINALKDNTFKDITFDEIEIMFNKNLTKIESNAFNGTNCVTSTVSFAYNSNFSDLSLYDILSKFQNLSTIHIYDNNITIIPKNAFKNNNAIKRLVIGGNKLSKIEERAFENMTNLQRIDIFNTSISYIPEKAFPFVKQPNNSEKRIVFRFVNNILLIGNSFADNCFSQSDRRIELAFFTLQGNRNMGNITFLKEKVFLSFLTHNNYNNLRVHPLDCNDCRNYWLTKEPRVQSRIPGLTCSTGKRFKDASNFKNCSN